jgi:hypothetical protein
MDRPFLVHPFIHLSVTGGCPNPKNDNEKKEKPLIPVP